MSDAHAGDGTRRDFLYIATGAFGAVGVVGAVWPLIAQMAPDEAVVAAGLPIELDVSSIEPGVQLVTVWRGNPYFVRRLTADEISAAKAAEKGKFIEFAPADDRLAAPEGGTAEWTIVSASCTHLGCVPKQISGGLDGWNCPCHGSKFDVTGRVTRGPAPSNLPLPPFNFVSANKLIIGEKPSEKKKEA